MSRHVEHVVFFTFGELTQEDEDLLTGIVAEMKVIPGVLDISFGKNFSPARAQGFTHALRARLENKEVLPVYANHELHQKFVTNRIPFDKAGPVALDWEV